MSFPIGKDFSYDDSPGSEYRNGRKKCLFPAPPGENIAYAAIAPIVSIDGNGDLADEGAADPGVSDAVTVTTPLPGHSWNLTSLHTLQEPW